MTDRILEPPDQTRLEFVHNTDRYCAYRDDAAAAAAGWTSGNGGEVWTVYPRTVPVTWTRMVSEFSESLRDATRLIPVTADISVRVEVVVNHIARRVYGVTTDPDTALAWVQRLADRYNNNRLAGSRAVQLVTAPAGRWWPTSDLKDGRD